MDIMNVVRLCETLNVLPRVGGLLDQDSLFIEFMLHIKDADRVRKEIDDRKAANAGGNHGA